MGHQGTSTLLAGVRRARAAVRACLRGVACCVLGDAAPWQCCRCCATLPKLPPPATHILRILISRVVFLDHHQSICPTRAPFASKHNSQGINDSCMQHIYRRLFKHLQHALRVTCGCHSACRAHSFFWQPMIEKLRAPSLCSDLYHVVHTDSDVHCARSAASPSSHRRLSRIAPHRSWEWPLPQTPLRPAAGAQSGNHCGPCSIGVSQAGAGWQVRAG
jgi:hypothetical protein